MMDTTQLISTAFIDLATSKGQTASTYKVDNNDGLYHATKISLRLFADHSAWGGSWENSTQNDYIDFAYIAMVDELADLKEFVSEPTYHFGYSNNWFHTHYTFSNMCYGALDRWGVDKGDTGLKQDGRSAVVVN